MSLERNPLLGKASSNSGAKHVASMPNALRPSASACKELNELEARGKDARDKRVMAVGHIMKKSLQTIGGLHNLHVTLAIDAQYRT